MAKKKGEIRYVLSVRGADEHFLVVEGDGKGGGKYGVFSLDDLGKPELFERFDLLADAVQVAGVLAVERTAYHAYEGASKCE